jgi:hypothetical protein
MKLKVQTKMMWICLKDFVKWRDSLEVGFFRRNYANPRSKVLSVSATDLAVSNLMNIWFECVLEVEELRLLLSRIRTLVIISGYIC